MGGITVTRRPKIPRFNGRGVAATIKAAVPGNIIRRTGRGVDMNGRQFAAYSRRYLRQLKRMGEDPTVDLRMSGGMINSIKARGVEVTDNRVVVTIAPDTGTSPQYAPPSTRGELAKTSWDRGRGLFAEDAGYAGPLRRGASTKLAKALTPRKIDTGRRGPQHNILAHYLHYGTGRLPARPFLGLTPEETKMLFDEIRKIMWK